MLLPEKAPPRRRSALFAGGCWALVAVAGVSLIARPSRERGSTRLDTAMVDDAPPATSDTDPTRASAPHDAFSYSYATAEATHAPHIVYILADDLGWNDVGYQSSDLDGFSPTLDHLANGGVRLTSFYALHQCTPARSALLSGYYPIHTGMYHGTILAEMPWGLPLQFTLLPEWLQEAANYSTQAIGKWDVGHFAKDYVPTSRGFDGFLGYYSAYVGYFSWVAATDYCELDPAEPYCWVDMHDDAAPGADSHSSSTLPTPTGEYSTSLFSRRAVDVVRTHASLYGGAGAMTKPLFLYFAPTAVHAPTKVPNSFFRAHKHELSAFENLGRQLVAAELLFLDYAVANITDALRDTDMYDNCVIIFSSDNGPVPSSTNGGGSAAPLRGRKLFLWEGGVRVPAFVHSPLLPEAALGTEFSGLFHITDWIPTLVGGLLNRTDLLEALPTGGLDGVDQWAALKGERANAHPRQEVLLNIDNFNMTSMLYHAAIRVGKWKLVHEINQTWWAVPLGADPPMTNEQMMLMGDDLEINLMIDPELATPVSALYDIDADETERHDLSAKHPDVVADLRARLARYASNMTASNWCNDAAHRTIAWAVFEKHGGYVVPWLDDADYMYKCSGTGVRGGDSDPPQDPEGGPADGGMDGGPGRRALTRRRAGL